MSRSIRKHAVARGILLVVALCLVGLFVILARDHPLFPPPEATQPVLHETWDVLSIADKRIGFSHMRRWRGNRDGRPVVITETQERIQMLRQGESVRLEVTYRTEETPAGKLVAVYCSQQSEREQTITQTGYFAKGQLHINKQTASSRSRRPESESSVTTSIIDWPEGTQGYHGLEQSLRHEMLVPGTQRTIYCLIPLINQIARLDMVAKKFEPVEMASGPTEGLRVEIACWLGDMKLPERILWCDAMGEVIKTLEPAMQMVSERTTREVAQTESSTPQYDIIERSLVRIVPPRMNLLEKEQSVFLITMAQGSPADHFARDWRQQIEVLDSHRARLTTKATWNLAGVQERQGTESSPPGEGSLASSPLIESDDPQIMELAASLASPQASPAAIALALEQWVYGWIEQKDYGQVFSSASDVVASHQGDCTEHAVLLAAVCRARKIPTRLVIGLIYVREMGGFLFHMWTESWWDGCWHPLDATLGRGGIGATHLKLHDFTLAGDNLLAEMLAVSQVIGQLAIEVEEVQ
jgi:transglutaminase superfamily protein